MVMGNHSRAGQLKISATLQSNDWAIHVVILGWFSGTHGDIYSQQ